MPEELQDEELNIHYIPKNFADKGRVLNGLFKTRNFIEACVVTIPVAAILFFCTKSVPSNWRMFVILAPCVFLFMVGVAGVNGDSLFDFVSHVMEFNRNRRVARYNNRVKHEAVPEYIINAKPVTPLDQMVEKVRNLINGDSTEQHDADDIYGENMSKFVFEDDIGVPGLDTPKEFKTKKELREEAKQMKRMQKEARRIQIQREKEQMLVQQEAERMMKEQRRHRRR